MGCCFFKNIRKLFLFFLFVFISVFVGNDVEAAQIVWTRCDVSQYGVDLDKIEPYSVKNHVADPDNANYFSSFVGNGRVVYCTEKGVPSMNYGPVGGPLYGPEWVSSNGNVDGNVLHRTLAYGYQASATSPSCNTDMAATQMIVWFASKEVTDGTKTWRNLTESDLKGMITGSYASTIASKAYNLMQLVLNHKLTPDFTKATSAGATSNENRVVLKYSESSHSFSNKYTDGHKILSSWTLGSNPSKVTATKSSNTLTITSKDDSVTTPISMKKSFRTGCKYYSRTASDLTLQDTAYVVECDNTDLMAYAGYRYEEIGKGTIKINKKDRYTDENLSGVTFGIYSDNKCSVAATDYLGNKLSEKTTGADGVVSWNNLYYPLGETRYYYIKETKTPTGYLGVSECIPQKINSSSSNAIVSDTIYNVPYGNITILKQDSETGSLIEGVEFRLLKEIVEVPVSLENEEIIEIDGKNYKIATDVYGKKVENAVTGLNGVAEFENIPYGDYYVEEVKSNASYKVLTELVFITLDETTDALKYKDNGVDTLPEGETLVPLDTYKLGDPSNDGIIDDKDIEIITGIIEKTITPTDKEKYASDVNLDGVVSELDKDLVISYITGKTDAFLDPLKEIALPGQFQKRVTIVVTNVPIDIKISKYEIAKSKELKGATIVIKNSLGEVFAEYVSDGNVKELYIPIGEYTLIETVSPKGYEKLKTEIKFKVNPDGNVELLSAKSNMYTLVNSNTEDDVDLDHLIIYNNVEKVIIPDTGSTVAVVGIVLGIFLISFGGYQVYRRYKF